ncbi:MAG: ATP synthase F1 subunit epsilon [Rhodospirillales bacterium]|nr:ATP synthase F1 subunit epsilon [Rhodospirillales bacterium]
MADTFAFEIVTPAKPLLAQEAELVIIPGAAGDFGVLPGHAPLLSTLRPGTIQIRDKTLKILEQYFVEGGFAEVTPERCTILAEEALRVAELSRDDAEARVKRAHDALMLSKNLGVRTQAERDVRAAEAMVAAIDAYESGVLRSH